MYNEKTSYLKDQVAFITGGTSGIGQEVARLFALHGAHVLIMGTNEKNAQNTAELLKKTAHLQEQQCDYFLGDVSSAKDVERVQKEIEGKGFSVNLLINNAGITRDNLLIRMPEKDFDDVVAVNLKGVFLVCKAFLPAMLKKRKGSIVNISSVIGRIGNPGQANYAASKAGVIGFTQSLAKEIAKRGLRANAIAPGFITTRMTGSLPEKTIQLIKEKIPMRTFGSPDDVAKAALFLASDVLSGYITGQTLHVDGGMVM
ncbi:MAG: 3-oxoacyl-[acyl-carrier-protein] reductase [Chlamydiota bacterium]